MTYCISSCVPCHTKPGPFVGVHQYFIVSFYLFWQYYLIKSSTQTSPCFAPYLPLLLRQMMLNKCWLTKPPLLASDRPDYRRLINTINQFCSSDFYFQILIISSTVHLLSPCSTEFCCAWKLFSFNLNKHKCTESMKVICSRLFQIKSETSVTTFETITGKSQSQPSTLTLITLKTRGCTPSLRMPLDKKKMWK